MNYDQIGFYLVADGSGEYRSYQQDLDEYMDYCSENEPEPEYDYWFDYDLIPNTHKHHWCIGQYGNVEENPTFDQYDGNF
ncbi:hypothetical protein [Geminocystis sp. GBBB08]|uniref:hypothetical protein n=1 Tax=Geminocystis sp. GBBB08 TaxID=2604140 RepID=UPI0027E35A81|nr:hypothetical protein [Geminocystis sp. GBBB08]MBL1208274.1 hypothetical protein [Geminocystis sp. GBBB08]